MGPVFSDEDWDEKIAREAAYEQLKHEKVEQFAVELNRRSKIVGQGYQVDGGNQAIIDAYANQEFHFTAEEVRQAEHEAMALMEQSREEQAEEEMIRRETRAVEKTKNK